MNADLEALIRLQETHNQIAVLTRRIEIEIPAHIDEVESELSVVREAVETARSSIEQANTARTRLEQELKLADDKLEKYKAALMQVKTNDEYRAALNEIDYMNRARSELESSILELMEDSEARKTQLESFEEEFKVEDEKIREDRKIHEDERSELVAERKVLEEAAASIEAGLPDARLRIFRRTASMRGGIALAQVSNGMCGACNVRLRPAMFQQVKRNDRIISCDSCGRVLYALEKTESTDAAPEAVEPVSGEAAVGTESAAGDSAPPVVPASSQSE